MSELPLSALGEYGVLLVIAAIFLGFIIHYLWKERPEERKYQRQLADTMAQQVALSTKAIETSNLVVAQNSEILKETANSHVRLGERFGRMEELYCDHDKRAQAMQVTLERVDTKLGD